jgi:hypothetical protein
MWKVIGENFLVGQLPLLQIHPDFQQLDKKMTIPYTNALVLQYMSDLTFHSGVFIPLEWHRFAGKS